MHWGIMNRNVVMGSSRTSEHLQVDSDGGYSYMGQVKSEFIQAASTWFISTPRMAGTFPVMMALESSPEAPHVLWWFCLCTEGNNNQSYSGAIIKVIIPDGCRQVKLNSYMATCS